MGRGPLVLAGVLTLVYLGTFSGLDDGMVLGNDAIPYAVEQARGAAHVSPHHLLFHPLVSLVRGLLAPLAHDQLSLRGPLGLAMTAQTLVSALGGGLAAAAFLAATRRLVGGGLLPWALTLVLAASAGHWLYASVGETYLPAIAAQTALVGLALVLRVERDGQATGRETAALAALLLLAVLLRQDSVLVTAAVVLLLAPRSAVVVVGAAGGSALAIYFGAWVFGGAAISGGPDHVVGFLPWLRGLADTGLWGGGLSAGKLQVAGSLSLAALAYPTYYAAQAAATGGATLEQGLVELALGLAPVLLLVLAVLAGRRRGVPTEPTGPRRRAALALAAFLVLRLGFFTWWQPGNLEYHAGHLAPALLLVAVLLRPGRAEPGPAAALVPRLVLLAGAVTLAGNWVALIEPNRTRDLHAVADEAMATVAPGGLVLSLDRLGHYANLRAAGTTARHVEPPLLLMDASDVAAGVDLETLDQLRGAIRSTLKRLGALPTGTPGGAPAVVATRDRILPPRFEHAPWPLDWSTGDHAGGMGRLVEGFLALPLDPVAGVESGLWELRPAP